MERVAATRSRPITAAAVVLSLGLHGVAYAMIGDGRPPAAPRGSEPVEFEDTDGMVAPDGEAGAPAPAPRPKAAAGPVSARRPAGAANPSKKVGRNDPCPCGSGKKYKKCCGRGK
jgi:hypothetical protein